MLYLENIKDIISKPILKQFVLYAIIGLLGFITDLGSYSLLKFNFNVPYLIAFLIGKSFGITQNFILNTIFNFKTTSSVFRRFISFYTVGLIGLGIGTILMYTSVDILKMNSLLSNIFVTLLIAIIQFLVNRSLTFKKNF